MNRYRLRRYTKGAFPKRFVTDEIIEEFEYWKDASKKSMDLNRELCEEQGYEKRPGNEPGWYLEEITPENSEKKPRRVRAKPIF